MAKKGIFRSVHCTQTWHLEKGPVLQSHSFDLTHPEPPPPPAKWEMPRGKPLYDNFPNVPISAVQSSDKLV